MIHTIFYVGILQYDAWIFFFLHTRIKLYISKLENGIDQKALATTNLCERKMYWFNFLQKQSPKMYSNDKNVSHGRLQMVYYRQQIWKKSHHSLLYKSKNRDNESRNLMGRFRCWRGAINHSYGFWLVTGSSFGEDVRLHSLHRQPPRSSLATGSWLAVHPLFMCPEI